MLQNSKELKEKLKKYTRKNSDTFSNGGSGSDKVKLGTPGWKQRYYKEKFLADPADIETKRKEIVEKYTEGLCWVLLYYNSEIPSWNWYYPYHHGPFASDLKGLTQVKVKFQKGSPFDPFDQLMAVLPPRSAHALPKLYQELMTDSSSSIIEFYPRDFEVDVDGKRFMWQGICKLPFINQEVLLSATKKLKGKLEETEASRNIQGSNQLLTRGSNRADGKIWSYLQQRAETKELTIQPADGENEILCSNFELPIASVHIPRLLEGVQLPEKMILENDIMETPLWHEYARPPTSRFPAQDRYRRFANDSKKEKMTQETSTPRSRGWFKEPTFDCKKDGTMRGSSAQSYKKERSTQETSTYKYPGPGRGFYQAGRGRGTSCSVSEPRYDNVNRWGKKPIGYQQSSMSATSFGGYHHNPSPAVSYRNAVEAAPYISRGMENMRLSQSDASGSYRRRDRSAEIGFWTSRSSTVSHDNSSWRPASHAKPTSEGGNMQQFTGRGRGQFRPN